MPISITAERAKDRKRQQKRRTKMAAAKAPTTHTVNRAIVEAMFYCTEKHLEDGTHRMNTRVTLGEVLAHAAAILTVGNNLASSYSRPEVEKAIKARAKRNPMVWTLSTPPRKTPEDA